MLKWFLIKKKKKKKEKKNGSFQKKIFFTTAKRKLNYKPKILDHQQNKNPNLRQAGKFVSQNNQVFLQISQGFEVLLN